MKRPAASGFTLIELLMVVATLGVLMAIVTPAVLNALHRGRQARTMSDLQALGKALEIYAQDNSRYPVAATINDLEGVLEPVFMRNVPLEDGWGHSIVVDTTTTDYTLGSGGRDGGSLNLIGGIISDFDDAIIFSNGQFVQWPEGAQL